VDLPIPPGCQMMPVETAQEMLETCEGELPCDIAIFAAAVADWRIAARSAEKLKKSKEGPPSLVLAENPDILKSIASRRDKRPALVVGFAAETENVIANAREKLQRKGCDLIVANDVSPEKGVFGGDRNMVHLVTANGVESWPEMTKQQVARKLMETLASSLPSLARAAE
jgi:phosphopantothenoylcysteine decarboxylase/phosphopantothenate--cysteine ligase